MYHRFTYTVSRIRQISLRDYSTTFPTYISVSQVRLEITSETNNPRFRPVLGVITYSSNVDTSTIVRRLASNNPETPLRILLETDAPYMVPANLYDSLPAMRGKLPVCHSAMVPWTAQFVVGVAGEGWDADRVMRDARENARLVYGV